MIKLNIKPLSVNKAWKGKRFKTPEYKNYENEVLWSLPHIDLPEPPFNVYYKFGFSSAASDIDNPVKPIQDIIAKYYKFDDKLIHKITIEKAKVKKGNEYIIFNIQTLNT